MLSHAEFLRQWPVGQRSAATKPELIARSSICEIPEIHFHSFLTISHIHPDYSSIQAKSLKDFSTEAKTVAGRDPFQNPFPTTDPARREIWEMLVPRDIDAFVAADWAAVADDFIVANFTGLSAHFQPDPQGYTLAFPTLAAYRQEWLRQAAEFGAARMAGAFVGSPRDGIFAATRLEEIEITGEAALVRKKFDGRLAKSDGSFDRMNWQTLYICRFDAGRWKIAGFVGYLPHIKE